MKVFISSTYEDLIDYRQAAIEAVNRYECVPLAMEFMMAQPGDATTVSKKEVEECDIFVGIYAHRYGYIPDGQKKSITQQEYELAKEKKKDCLCFIVNKNHPWDPELMEFDKRAQLLAFLDIVKKEKVVGFFGSTADFSSKISSSLGKFLQERQSKQEPEEKKKQEKTFIPLPPTPYVAHPYALPEHFTGREGEQARLSNWFLNEKEAVLVMEAIGGMGKTALSWVWLHRRVIEPGIETAGIFWWSFYEANFACFLRALAGYVVGREIGPEGVTQDEIARLLPALHSRRFLLILDGFERALRGYSGMDVMYRQEKGLPGKKEEEEWERRQREAVHPAAEKFLRHLCSGSTKTLLTTRLNPAALEGFTGVRHVFLTGLNPVDAVAFFRSEGIQGSRSELEQASKVYDYHPLMLKLLTSAIDRSRTKDIKDAYRHQLIDRREPQKILTTSYNLLSTEERRVVSHIAIFRGVFTFDSVQAIFPETEEERLWPLLHELCRLGFLFYDEKEDRFDFHPILRAYLYAGLSGREEVHRRAVVYFQALPKPEKIISLHDLEPAIELYHHLVKGGRYDEAYTLFYNRITDPIFFQLSAYDLQIDLLKELFPDGEDQLPRLKEEGDQGWTLNTLANSYSLSGQPAKAVLLYLKSIFAEFEKNDKQGVATTLGNAAQFQLVTGQLSAAAAHQQKNILLGREIEDEFRQAIGHQEWGRALAYRGQPEAEDEFKRAFKIFEKGNKIQSLSVVSAHRSLSSLLQARLSALLPGEEKKSGEFCREAWSQAHKALSFAEKYTKTNYPIPRDFVRAYLFIGEALLQCVLSPVAVRFESYEVRFYDEYFQQEVAKVVIKPGREIEAAERCLGEALRRCRRVNLVESEPAILLACARLEWAKGIEQEEQAGALAPEAMVKNLEEARDIALRSGYRLNLTDIHLLCAQVLLRRKEKGEEKGAGAILGITAPEHLQKAKEYALDVSELSSLYQSKDTDFYKGIPEYDMLKRGMSDEERITNGYYVAYRIAEALGKRSRLL